MKHDDVVAASLPVAYLTAQITLTLAGFKPGMTVLAPAIGGSVGNATYPLARAQGAGKVISTTGSAAKAARGSSFKWVAATRVPRPDIPPYGPRRIWKTKNHSQHGSGEASAETVSSPNRNYTSREA
jgi:hypothetical protein